MASTKRISDMVLKGPERAPHRSLLYALGLSAEEMKRPLIGVVSSFNEIIPGHIHLDKIAEAVKTGVRIAGGTPILVPAIGVCDGIAMGHPGMKYSLPSRELIADSVETMALGQQAQTDIISIGLSATDYIGHSYGTEGTESCIQVDRLDRELGAFFDRLDKDGIDYVVVLTADHGGHDLPERHRLNAMPMDQLRDVISNAIGNTDVFDSLATDAEKREFAVDYLAETLHDGAAAA